ncbi:rRNA maturation RNase YbeY [Dyadobacter sp. BE34]|uniref:Endoribonuclease YbeY n=1 Tax=Dyadobacter fermentans TaxID=94254 RepID=A0ABU1R8Q6_9BACT|nr:MULTISPECIES: rRNA maturation RNase YbeY [Dyadobacter]MDR6809801.1 rRNA maturation RNase YbeY [Dyadobacter fermentans]MDR7047545.1 rRNA maturation RNase YbeY [Dyadobacter sp. BE242]MDR7201715.1 rRNA maturation RNase YbeY [Dyadobacter sp. BE34]MDR7219585.1 rRNA maturation RNase YbeY [Dyadobacter sp. BE31]MDR7267359.1 rRNA maturation RNase YbeY [Dyadobacter sp. BE32]
MVSFFSEDIDFKVVNPLKTRKWLKNASISEGYELSQLNYVFCSDEYLLEINKQYLDHDYFTDIITFDNSEEDNQLEGDIYISVDRVRENAATFHTDFDTEMRRVLIHGLLHLAGHDDTSEALKTAMRAKEDEYLRLF